MSFESYQFVFMSERACTKNRSFIFDMADFYPIILYRVHIEVRDFVQEYMHGKKNEIE